MTRFERRNWRVNWTQVRRHCSKQSEIWRSRPVRLDSPCGLGTSRMMKFGFLTKRELFMASLRRRSSIRSAFEELSILKTAKWYVRLWRILYERGRKIQRNTGWCCRMVEFAGLPGGAAPSSTAMETQSGCTVFCSMSRSAGLPKSGSG